MMESRRTTKREGLDGLDVTSSRIVANNTFEYYNSLGERIIRLHMTDILRFSPGGRMVTLDSGGWKTVTTKERINRFLPPGIHLHQSKGIWYVSTYVVKGGERTDFRETQYWDGMTVVDGVIDVPDNVVECHAEQARLTKLVDKYMVKFKAMDIIPNPSGGDCWMCMADTPKIREGSLLSNDHIITHLEEGYIHGTLIFNSLKWCGYGEEQMPYIVRIKDTLNRSMRRYLRYRIGLAA